MTKQDPELKALIARLESEGYVVIRRHGRRLTPDIIAIPADVAERVQVIVKTYQPSDHQIEELERLGKLGLNAQLICNNVAEQEKDARRDGRLAREQGKQRTCPDIGIEKGIAAYQRYRKHWLIGYDTSASEETAF